MRNWNQRVRRHTNRFLIRIYRTYEELKSADRMTKICAGLVGIYRTYEELKSRYTAGQVVKYKEGIYRTYEELKSKRTAERLYEVGQHLPYLWGIEIFGVTFRKPVDAVHLPYLWGIEISTSSPPFNHILPAFTVPMRNWNKQTIKGGNNMYNRHLPYLWGIEILQIFF